MGRGREGVKGNGWGGAGKGLWVGWAGQGLRGMGRVGQRRG